MKIRPITILIDRGSTHNFLDVSTIRILGCTSNETGPHSVAIMGAVIYHVLWSALPLYGLFRVQLFHH